MLPTFTPAQWGLAVLAAFCIGFSKSGFIGTGLLTVAIMAQLFSARESTCALLPLLIIGDIGAVLAFRQHARWPQIWRMLPPTLAGIIAGYAFMRAVPDARFGPIIGWIVLAMVVLQAARKLRPALYEGVPHTRPFACAMGATAGVTTMLANAAGPVFSLYLLALSLPKYALVGTSAWFFLIVNVIKVPFSAHLGLIHGSSLAFNLVLVPAVVAGVFAGRWLVAIIPQTVFEIVLLVFATAAALRLLGVF